MIINNDWIIFNKHIEYLFNNENVEFYKIIWYVIMYYSTL